MCAPAAVPIMMGIGALASASAARKQSKANEALYSHQAAMEAATAEQQAAVERNKAIVAEHQAKDALWRGSVETTRRQMETSQVAGAQRARFAAAGLDLTEGSAFNILEDTRFMGKYDESIIMHNAEKEAWMYRESARTGMSNAEFIRNQGATNAGFLRRRAAAESPSRAFTSSLLGSAGQVAASWYGMSRQSTY